MRCAAATRALAFVAGAACAAAAKLQDATRANVSAGPPKTLTTEDRVKGFKLQWESTWRDKLRPFAVFAGDHLILRAKPDTYQKTEKVFSYSLSNLAKAPQMRKINFFMGRNLCMGAAHALTWECDPFDGDGVTKLHWWAFETATTHEHKLVDLTWIGRVSCAEISADGAFALLSNVREYQAPKLQLVDLKTGQAMPEKRMTLPPGVEETGWAQVQATALSHDGSKILVLVEPKFDVTRSTLQIWSVKQMSLEAEVSLGPQQKQSYGRGPPKVACSPDGRKVLVTGPWGELWIYNLRMNNIEKFFGAKTCFGCSKPVFSGDGKYAMMMSRDEAQWKKRWIQVWNLHKHVVEVKIELDENPREEPEIDISADGKFLLAMRNRREVFVWKRPGA